MNDPLKPSSDDRKAGLAMLGVILFCAASGIGVGVFFQEPDLGGVIGGAVGVVLGLILVPSLVRDWLD